MKHTLETNGRGGVRVAWQEQPTPGQVFTDLFGDEVVFDEIGPAGMILCTRKSDGIQQAHMPHELTPSNAKVSGAGTASAGLPGWQANGKTE